MLKLNSNLLLILTLIVKNSLTQNLDPDPTSKVLTIYFKTNFEGESVHVNVSGCMTLTHGINFDNSTDGNTLNGPPTSIKINTGDCFQLYQDVDCTSESIMVKLGIPALNDLSRWNHPAWTHDKIMAVAPCEEKCNPNKINETHSANENTPIVTLYSQFQFGGTAKFLRIGKGCILIPIDLRRAASSVQIHGLDCIELHEEWNCLGHSIQIKKDYPLRFLADLSEWNFNTKAMAVSKCGYQCTVNAHSENKTTSQTIYDPPPWPNAATLFSQPNYKGKSLNLSLTEECQNFTDRWTRREGTQSIKVYYEGCISVFEEYGCDNKTSGKITQFKESIPFLDYNDGIKSIKLCKIAENASSKIPHAPNPIQIETDSKYLQVIYIAIAVVVAILILGFLITILITCTRNKGYVEMLNAKEIQEFRNGLDVPLMELNGDFDVLQQSQPYDQQLEISKEYITVEKKSILGEGEFGIVHRGKIHPPCLFEAKVVAIKSVKPYCQIDYVRAMLKEIKTMIYVGKHPNIVTLVGCHTKNLKNSELLIITELCENGSLEKLLQNTRQSFVSLVPTPTNSIGNSELIHSNNYTNIKPTNGNVNTIHLLQWSLQIAQGMEHLESKMVVHGDLAIRNILLDEGFKAKISDFGLSNQLYTKKYYTKKAQAPMPWRSMALESLRNLKFSTQSDIWSYGITLWEIFSLGDVPFPGRVWSDQFLDELSCGLRPPKPNNATVEIYEVMQNCWKENPKERKSFSNMRKNLGDLLTIRYFNCAPEKRYQNVQEDIVLFNCETKTITIDDFKNKATILQSFKPSS